MECAIITTYRCNARCRMCNIWQHPSKTSEEFLPEILEKIPSGMQRLNITGGEPLLRHDIKDIVSILNKKTNRLEISTNGFFYDKIIDIARAFHNITIRVSIEGLPAQNDRLRGIKHGFDRAMRTMLGLKRLGIKDIGFAMTLSGENCRDLLELYSLATFMDVEFANAVIHNSFYFHKDDNQIANLKEMDQELTRFIEALLLSSRKNIKRRIKDWLRAYLNQGLLRHAQGKLRTIRCNAATDTFFVDPWGRVLACNGSNAPLVMGDLNSKSFQEIWEGEDAVRVRELVSKCDRNCWMTGTAVPAMRGNPLKPALWVLKNKFRLSLGLPVRFE